MIGLMSAVCEPSYLAEGDAAEHRLLLAYLHGNCLLKHLNISGFKGLFQPLILYIFAIGYDGDSMLFEQALKKGRFVSFSVKNKSAYRWLMIGLCLVFIICFFFLCR